MEAGKEAAFLEIVGLAERFGNVAKAARIVGLTLAVDPRDGMARCEFLSGDEQLASVVVAVMTTALTLLPVDEMLPFIMEVSQRVTYNLFDSRSPFYRPRPESEPKRGSSAS